MEDVSTLVTPTPAVIVEIEARQTTEKKQFGSDSGALAQMVQESEASVAERQAEARRAAREKEQEAKRKAQEEAKRKAEAAARAKKMAELRAKRKEMAVYD